jgi:hypothetical protein
MAEKGDPFAGGDGGFSFSPIKPSGGGSLFDDDFWGSTDIIEFSPSPWQRVAQSVVLADRSLPLLLIKVPKPVTRAGEGDFTVEVKTRDMPPEATGEFFLEVVPWSFEGSSREMGDAVKPPVEGVGIGGFRLPMINDPEFNRQFYFVRRPEDVDVLFTMRAGVIGNNWTYSIPSYAISPEMASANPTLPDSFVVAVNDRLEIEEPILNVMTFTRMELQCKVCSLPTNKRCKICKVAYCGNVCRDADWHKHKHECTRN